MTEDYLVTEIVDSLPKVTSIMKRLNAKKFGDRVFFFELIDLDALYHGKYHVWKDGKAVLAVNVIGFERVPLYRSPINSAYRNRTELFHLKVYRTRIKKA